MTRYFIASARVLSTSGDVVKTVPLEEKRLKTHLTRSQPETYERLPGGPARSDASLRTARVSLVMALKMWELEHVKENDP